MAENVQTFVSTGATLPVGTGVVFDSITIGASTGNVEYVKLMSGSSGSTVTVAASSAALGGIGLQSFVVNSTTQPIGVKIHDGLSTVTVAGSVAVTFSTASTASVLIANTTAAAGIVQLAYNSSLVSTSTPLPVLLQGSTATVTIQGNSTAIISTASKIQAELSTTLMGGSTGNPVYVVNKPWSLFANSTWAVGKVTSTATATIFSSAASTRFNMVDLVLTNAGTAEVVATIYDGSTTGTKLFQTDLASAGGGVSIQFGSPRRTSSGLGMIIETVPASSVYYNVGAFKTA